jgi:hypothetical protein
MPSHVYVGRAIKDLANLDSVRQERIDAALTRLTGTRQGDEPGVIEVFRIDNRGEAY